MSEWSVQFVSAFGRGQTLALALQESGFQVRILDFSSAFAEEYRPSAGPFPLLDKTYLPQQHEYLQQAVPLEQGLNFWMKDGPLELTGPFAELHAQHHPAVGVWKSGADSRDFDRVWLSRFLKQWASPFLREPWQATNDPAFPAEADLMIVPEEREATAQSFASVQSRGVEVLLATRLLEARVSGSRLDGVEVEAGSPLALKSAQWVWCLSAAETSALGEAAARRVFKRGVRASDWAWISFGGSCRKGPWTQGFPLYTIVMGDTHLPWTYANAVVMKRSDDTRFRFWLKVPCARAQELDARRAWAQDLQSRLLARLPLADWKVDSAEWSICPHSPVYGDSVHEEGLVQYRNWDWIAPETLPRLDMSARFEREAQAFKRLQQWRADLQKKKGAPRDQSLHAP